MRRNDSFGRSKSPQTPQLFPRVKGARARCLIVASTVSSLRSMRLLDRYLLRELLTPLGYCLVGFLVLIVAADLTGRVDDFHTHRMHFGDVCLYYAVQLPEMLVKIMPMTLLLALL